MEESTDASYVPSAREQARNRRASRFETEYIEGEEVPAADAMDTQSSAIGTDVASEKDRAQMRKQQAQLELAQAEERHRQMEAAVSARKVAPPTSVSLDEEMDRDMAELDINSGKLLGAEVLEASPLTASEIGLLENLGTEKTTPMDAEASAQAAGSSSGGGGGYRRERTGEIGEDGDDVAAAEEAAYVAANTDGAAPPPPPPALGTAVSRQASIPAPPPPPPLGTQQLKFFPEIPEPLRPLSPFIYEADNLLQTSYTHNVDDTARAESQLMAYYCVCHAIWIGTTAGNQDHDCKAFLIHLQQVSLQCRPNIAEVPEGLDDDEWRDCVADLLNSITFICRDQAKDEAETDYMKQVFDNCCIPVGPERTPESWKRLEIFENVTISNVVPMHRPPYSDETGRIEVDILDKNDVQAPEGYQWATEWASDLTYTRCDAEGWSYALNFSLLSVHMRQRRSLSQPTNWSLVKRRKWFRIMRVIAVPDSRTPTPPQVEHNQVDTAAAEGPGALPGPGELPLAGREMLMRHALHMVKIVIVQEQNKGSHPLLLRRWCHTALVYLEVLRGQDELPIQLEAQRRKVHRLVRTWSHMHENMIHEVGGSTVTDNDLSSGRAFDAYAIDHEQLLGKGSFGTVVRAVHKQTSVSYACKVLNISHIMPAYIDKLHSEIMVMRQMDHPNVVRLREVFYGKQRIYLIMDECTGGELFDLLDRQPGHHCTENFTARVVLQMLSALRYMHAHGVMHRDLKLENWLLSSPDDPTLQLIDFGLSKHFMPEEMIKGAVGSAYYVAPEVLQGEYTELCDMWSLGVITYMLVSGSPPFWGKDDRGIRQHIISGKYRFPSKAFDKVTDQCKDFIRSLLVLNPDERLTAEEALEHPWLVTNDPSKSEPVVANAQGFGNMPEPAVWDKAELLGSLRGFTDSTLIQKLSLKVIAFHMTPREIKGLRDLFVAIDQDHSGVVSFEELRNATLTHAQEGDAALTSEISRIFESVNTSHTQGINYAEFVAACMWKRIHYDEAHLRQVFDTLDVNNLGYIDVAGVTSMVGLDFEGEDVAAMIRDADVNGDGRVDLQEFVNVWKKMAVEQHYKPLTSARSAGNVVMAAVHWKRRSHSHSHSAGAEAVEDAASGGTVTPSSFDGSSGGGGLSAGGGGGGNGSQGSNGSLNTLGKRLMKDRSTASMEGDQPEGKRKGERMGESLW
mmetsp:Transcript_54851/g.151182  ORF Transcript_54851/g.151182 Transcript_54851/m.151182 type:complete len:1189 (-) Transcript_54851:129-3695(-)